MAIDNYDLAEFFTGIEVEHTAAFGKKTLFVQGHPASKLIIEVAREHETPHIYLGANHSVNTYTTSFPKNDWSKTITELLAKDFWVSFDYESYLHKTFLNIIKPEVWKSKKFIPLLSVHIPDVKTINPNLIVKIADAEFKGSNNGVWCHNVADLTADEIMTPWKKKKKDETISYLD